MIPLIALAPVLVWLVILALLAWRRPALAWSVAGFLTITLVAVEGVVAISRHAT